MQIGVIGYNSGSFPIKSKTLDLAYEVGSFIARKNAILVCGGLGGVMEHSCKGAKDNNGFTIGIVPQEDYLSANKYCDAVICTGIGLSRDFIVAYSSDGLISIGGGVGTLIELCVGYIAKKPMISISDSGGTSDIYGGKYLDERNRVIIEKTKSPMDAVEYINKKSNIDQ